MTVLYDWKTSVRAHVLLTLTLATLKCLMIQIGLMMKIGTSALVRQALEFDTYCIVRQALEFDRVKLDSRVRYLDDSLNALI